MSKASLNQETFRFLTLVTQLGLVMVFTILTGLFLGVMLDRLFHWNGICSVVFVVMGVAAGFYQVWRLLIRSLSSDKKE